MPSNTDFATSPTYQRGARIKNVGDEPYTDSYDGVKFHIAAGSDQFVPFDAAALWLGDPRLYDTGPGANHRTDEYTRIAFRMGCVEADMDEFEQNKPRLEVYSPDGDTRYMMVADDPTGPGQNIFESDTQDMSDPEVRIRLLEERLRELEAKTGSEPSQIDDTLAELGIGSDEPKSSAGGAGSSGVKAGSKGGQSGGLPPADEPNIPKGNQ